MVAEYVSLRHKALKESTPALCFRDLLKRAEQELMALSKLHPLMSEKKEKLLLPTVPKVDKNREIDKSIYESTYSFFGENKPEDTNNIEDPIDRADSNKSI
jgi:hypothetical protein